jgi:hypothetical protein
MPRHLARGLSCPPLCPLSPGPGGRPYGRLTGPGQHVRPRATAPADLALGGGVGTCGVPTCMRGRGASPLVAAFTCLGKGRD